MNMTVMAKSFAIFSFVKIKLIEYVITLIEHVITVIEDAENCACTFFDVCSNLFIYIYNYKIYIYIIITIPNSSFM